MRILLDNLNAADTGSITTNTIVSIVLYVLLVIALWRIFTKAGYAGWLAIIPIVNTIVIIKIAGLSGWWVLLYLVPIANIVLSIIVAIRLAKNFGKGGVFGFFLLWLLSIIGYFILGYGNSKYVGPAKA